MDKYREKGNYQGIWSMSGMNDGSNVLAGLQVRCHGLPG